MVIPYERFAKYCRLFLRTQSITEVADVNVCESINSGMMVFPLHQSLSLQRARLLHCSSEGPRSLLRLISIVPSSITSTPSIVIMRAPFSAIRPSRNIGFQYEAHFRAYRICFSNFCWRSSMKVKRL